MIEEQFKKELERAYRAIVALYNNLPTGDTVQSIIAYHSLTIGAALRYVHEGSLDGSEYFEGKHVDTLHKALKLANKGPRL